MNKINLLNSAWVGQGDFGDEAMAYALRKIIKMSCLTDNIAYYQHGRYAKYREENDLTDIKIIHNFRWFTRFKKHLDFIFLKNYNVLVIGGGSVINSEDGIKKKLYLIEKIRYNNSKSYTAAIGISIGPFNSKKAENLCCILLEKLDIIITRDKYSFDLAQQLSSKNNAICSLDTTLALPEISKKFLSIKVHEREAERVGVSFIYKKNWHYNKQKFITKYIQIINSILKKGKRITLFCLYIGEAYADIELANSLKQQSCSPNDVHIHIYNGDIFQTVHEINKCSFVISMRLHGIIFAYMLRIPFLSLEYNPKNTYFCQSIGYPKDMAINYNPPDKNNLVMEKIDKLFDQNRILFNGVKTIQESSNHVVNSINTFINEVRKRYY